MGRRRLGRRHEAGGFNDPATLALSKGERDAPVASQLERLALECILRLHVGESWHLAPTTSRPSAGFGQTLACRKPVH
jgi:hypothetical protein